MTKQQIIDRVIARYEAHYGVADTPVDAGYAAAFRMLMGLNPTLVGARIYFSCDNCGNDKGATRFSRALSNVWKEWEVCPVCGTGVTSQDVDDVRLPKPRKPAKD